MSEPLYRGRLAPSPTGYLHLGHARTFWMAQQRSEARGGTLVLRSEDLFLVGRDFGDFVVCRHDQIPSYQLAVVVDDAAMRITEVVRGADLLLSTARQILLYRALGWPAPVFFHCPLLADERGVRLAKRHDALSLRMLRESGASAEALRKSWRA